MPLFPIESERLKLRAFELSDLDSLLPYHSDLEVVRFIPWPQRNREQVQEWLEKAIHLSTFEGEGDYLTAAIIRKEDNQLIGQVNSMFRSLHNQTAEIGYVLNPQFGGQGYATEAAAALVGALFATGTFRRITARLDTRNDASARVLERLRFRREAHFIEDDLFKGEWTSTYEYSVLKHEWEQR